MIVHNKPTFGLEEQAATARVLASNWIAQGPEVAAFESELCQYFGVPDGHVVLVSSGTAALYLSLWALGGKGARVGIPVYSCSALRNAVGMIGGECVLLDCAEDSPNLDITQAKQAEVDILLAPSMYGIPVDLPEDRNFAVIEDLAQALGAAVNGKPIGLRGELGVCSFYATKMITSGGQGGAVVAREKHSIDLIRDYREFDCRNDKQLRFNFQMTDMQAAIGRVQLRKLPAFIRRREKWFEIYQEAGLDLIDCKNSEIKPVRYRIVTHCRNPDEMIRYLSDSGIRAIVPVEEYELLGPPINFPRARKLSRMTVSLPAYPGLEMCDVVRIAKIAKEIKCS